MDGILTGLSLLGTSAYWIAFFAAITMAAFAGLVPGASASLLMALAIPFIVFNVQDPVIGIVMLATITAVDDMLDVLPIVALGHPGGGQVTFLEARPLVAKGHAARVLGFIYMVSLTGGLIGAAALLLIVPIVKPFILQFSFAEIAALGVFGVVIVGALSRGAMIKGLTAGLIGLLLSTIGVSPFSGEARFTFDQFEFQEGLPLIATIIGLFALPEMIDLLLTRRAASKLGTRLNTREVFRGAGLAFRYWRLIMRHSILGVFLGIIPGVGARVVSWLSYGIGISTTKNRRQFGKGSYRGLVFSESVQSSKEGGQALPTLALGIPGGQGWVFVMVAMIAYGVTPGPNLLSQHGDIIALIVISLVLGNVVLALMGIFASGQLSKLSRVPYPILGAVVIPMAILSAFQETRHWTAIPTILGFAVIGLLMKSHKWPRPPLILGFILGSIIEKNGLSAMSLYGAVGTFTRPLTIALLILSAIVVAFFFRLAKYEKHVTSPDAEQVLETARVDPRKPWIWKSENYLGVFFMLAAVAFMWGSLDYRPVARNFPLALGGLIFVLCIWQIVKSGWERGDGDVLDIGMLSAEMDGTRRASFMLAGYFLGFIVLTYVIGLQYAAIIFAATIPAAFMTGRRPWAWGLLSGGILVALVFGLFNYLMNIVWPSSLLAGFLT